MYTLYLATLIDSTYSNVKFIAVLLTILNFGCNIELFNVSSLQYSFK